MKKRFCYLLILLIILAGCAPKAEVQVQLIETQTSLESQILGTYKQIGQEEWLISSVRGARGLPDNLSPSKKEVFLAIENQEFNADDIAEFKDAGALAENSQGQLVRRETPKLKEDPKYAKLVGEIIAEENNDRLIIIQRIILENPQLKETDLLVVQQAFARIYWQKASPQHWLITSEGKWLQRKDWSAK